MRCCAPVCVDEPHECTAIIWYHADNKSDPPDCMYKFQNYCKLNVFKRPKYSLNKYILILCIFLSVHFLQVYFVYINTKCSFQNV